METEVWKDIEGYEGLYQVSNMGNVKSLERTITCQDGSKRTYKSKLLKPQPNNMGYLRVGLSKNNNWIQFFVHRLVASTFLKNNNNLPCVNHKDENPLNNHVENLEYCNHTYNMNYGTIIERKRKSMKGKMSGENNPFYGKQHTQESKKKMGTPIIQYSKDNVFIKEFESITQASIELNISKNSICNCLKGKSKYCRGYIWRYKE